MTHILTKTSLFVTVVAGALVLSSAAGAQSNNNNQGSNQNGGPGIGQGGGDTSDNSKGDNENVPGLKKVKVDLGKNPNNNPRIPRIPRIPGKPKEVVAFESQRSPCGVIYNQITRQNMLVMVPRYNDCIRRGLEN